eukprot:7380767-Prymnesium_polylepis.2
MYSSSSRRATPPAAPRRLHMRSISPMRAFDAAPAPSRSIRLASPAPTRPDAPRHVRRENEAGYPLAPGDMYTRKAATSPSSLATYTPLPRSRTFDMSPGSRMET